MIRIDQVSKQFARRRVLETISLDIGADDRIALIGSNGAGKTTLIRCLLGEYVHEGEIWFEGKSPRQNRCEVLRQVGFVPQLPPPLKMPVHELLHYSAVVNGSDKADIIDIANRLGLDVEEVGKKPFIKLSGGQKQKVLVAIAMGKDTRLLILDEPTANLDPAARQILFDLLAERAGQPVIISSHRLEEVAGLVNRVIEMDQGQIVLDDKVEDCVDPSSRLACQITLARAEEAFAKAIRDWGFTSSDGLHWQGLVAGPDRLRFLGILSRHAGLLAGISMEPAERATNEAAQ